MTLAEMRRLAEAVLCDPIPDAATSLASALLDLLPVVESACAWRDAGEDREHESGLLECDVDTLRGKGRP